MNKLQENSTVIRYILMTVLYLFCLAKVFILLGMRGIHSLRTSRCVSYSAREENSSCVVWPVRVAEGYSYSSCSEVECISQRMLSSVAEINKSQDLSDFMRWTLIFHSCIWSSMHTFTVGKLSGQWWLKAQGAVSLEALSLLIKDLKDDYERRQGGLRVQD